MMLRKVLRVGRKHWVKCRMWIIKRILIKMD